MGNYNVCAQFEIIGRITDKTCVLGYMIRDRITGETGMREKGIIEQLAINKQIFNAQAQVWENTVNIKGINCKISKMPRYDKTGRLIEEDKKENQRNKPFLNLIGKVQDGRTIIAYIVEFNKGGELVKAKVSRDDVIKLARDGKIINAKAQSSKGKLMLRNRNGESLDSLAVYR